MDAVMSFGFSADFAVWLRHQSPFASRNPVGGGRRKAGHGALASAEMRRPLFIGFATLTLAAAGCGSTAEPTSLDIDTQMGYAVIVEQLPDRISIGFNTNRDAAAGEAYDVTQAVWRVGDGPWNEPPVTCLSKGQRVQLGVTMVENETRPGLLMERVVWLVCLPPS